MAKKACHLCAKAASSQDGKLVGPINASSKGEVASKYAPAWMAVCRTCGPPKVQGGRYRERFVSFCLRATLLGTEASRPPTRRGEDWYVHDACRKAFNKGPTQNQQSCDCAQNGGGGASDGSAGNNEAFRGMYGRESSTRKSSTTGAPPKPMLSEQVEDYQTAITDYEEATRTWKTVSAKSTKDFKNQLALYNKIARKKLPVQPFIPNALPRYEHGSDED